MNRLLFDVRVGERFVPSFFSAKCYILLVLVVLNGAEKYLYK